MKLRQYISSLRTLLNKGDCSRFVLGNSGADYDSVIGSILLAFYLTRTEGVLYLPLVDCLEIDLPLRFQQLKVFQTLEIKQEDLLFTSMVDNLYTGQNYFVLHDHNERTQIKEGFLYQVIDHHAYKQESMKCNHVIGHCGSALSLIFYLYYPQLLEKLKEQELYPKFMVYFEKHKNAIKKENEGTISQQLIDHLLLYGITIDTFGIHINHTQVWNQIDKIAYENLRQKIKPYFNFEQIAAAKYDSVQSMKLTFEQQRKKDYKDYQYGNFNIHYSTILFNIDDFVKIYWKDMQQKLHVEAMKDNQGYVFLFTFPSGPDDILEGIFRRYILFNAKNKEVISMMSKVISRLNFIQMQDIGSWNKWIDKSGRISRKAIDFQIRQQEKQGLLQELDPLKDL